MRLFVTAAAILAFAPLLTPAAALAEPDASMAPAFKGTIVSTYPDGRKGRLWLSEDGSYKASGRRGDMSSGHWKVKGDNVCLSEC